MSAYEVYSRKVAEMSSPCYKGLLDPFGVLALTAEKRRTFSRNPYVYGETVHCQSVAVRENIAFGGDISFPIKWLIRGTQYDVHACSTTFVEENYRKYEFGLSCRDYRLKFTNAAITVGASSSQMMVKMIKALRNPLFFLPRYIMLFKSRSVVEMKLKGFWCKIASACVDVGLKLYWVAISLIAKIKLRGLSFEEISADDEKSIKIVADMIEADTHPFAELHDAKWLKWHMTESFTSDGPLKLVLVKKNDAPVAFYMTKVRFHEQASSRGFKNVWLGSIMEWQAIPEFEAKLPWVLVHAALSFKKKVDAIELVTEDSTLGAFVRKLGWRQVGDSNWNFKIWSGPLKGDKELKDGSKWRMRPAMGDAGFN